MSSVVTGPSSRVGTGSLVVAPVGARRRRRRPWGPGAVLGALVTALVVVSAFVAQGGSDLGRATSVEVALVVVAALSCITAIAAPRPADRDNRLAGATALVAFALLTLLTGLSIRWSIAPSDSWVETNRTFAYLATFAAGIAFARVAGRRWGAMLVAVAVAAVVLAGWGLMTKIYPDTLAPDEPFARLRPPFAYWNAAGLAAALGVPALVWLGARRAGHGVVSALAWPGLAIVLTALMLAYSRGGLLAAGLGLVAWLIVVPLRLRTCAMLAGVVVLTAPVVAWAFAQDGLTVDRAPIVARTDAGHELGSLLALLVACALIAGMAAGFLASRHHASRTARRRAGGVLLAAVAAVPIVVVAALAGAPGGIDGQVSKAYDQATNPDVKAPGNSPQRLTQTSSVRAAYWNEAFRVYDESKLLGSGAGAYDIARKRVRTEPVDVRHAHGYIPQTLADLGWAGMAVSLALLAAWLAAAARTLGITRRDRGHPWDTERVGVAALAATALVFGIHSTVDWTWFVPGNAVAGLLCAGWVAGRMPLRTRLYPPVPPPPDPDRDVDAEDAVADRAEVDGQVPLRRSRPAWIPPAGRFAATVAVLAVAAASIVAIVGPQRSAQASDQALDELADGNTGGALARQQDARDRNRLDVEPLFVLSTIEQTRNRLPQAQAALEQAVRMQPADPETWRRLADLEFNVRDNPRGALPDYQAVYNLDPLAPRSLADLVDVTRAVQGQR